MHKIPKKGGFKVVYYFYNRQSVIFLSKMPFISQIRAPASLWALKDSINPANQPHFNLFIMQVGGGAHHQVIDWGGGQETFKIAALFKEPAAGEEVV
jgi:hypothetical protein